MVKFGNRIFGFSRDINSQTLKNEFGNLIKPIQIFSIRFRKIFRHGENSHRNKIYDHIANYMELMFEHQETFFK